MDQALYDQIGRQYSTTRSADPRIAAAIDAALGHARSVLNVGAGTGSYEPINRFVIAVEPAQRMIAQRRREAAPVVQASSEALPFRDRSFDAALAVLTVHHWANWRIGIQEMRRVAGRIVIFTFEPGDVGRFWLTDAYFPEITELDRGRCPSIREVVNAVGRCTVERVPIPHDCSDGFLAAYWRRPEAYLDPAVRASISGLAMLGDDVIARGVKRLQADLDSGVWEERFGHVRTLESLDVCYRLLVADESGSLE